MTYCYAVFVYFHVFGVLGDMFERAGKRRGIGEEEREEEEDKEDKEDKEK